MDFHWYFIEISTRFQIYFYWHFIEISIGISLKFQLDFQWISIGVSLIEISTDIHCNDNWISIVISWISNVHLNFQLNFQFSISNFKLNLSKWIWTGFPMDFYLHFIEIATGFSKDFHWYHIDISSRYPMDFHWCFFEILTVISLKFQLD
jgi:hypothetical protein